MTKDGLRYALVWNWISTWFQKSCWSNSVLYCFSLDDWNGFTNYTLRSLRFCLHLVITGSDKLLWVSLSSLNIKWRSLVILLTPITFVATNIMVILFYPCFIISNIWNIINQNMISCKKLIITLGKSHRWLRGRKDLDRKKLTNVQK